LPLDSEKLEGNLFQPLFKAVADALSSEPLLPNADGGYVTAKEARLSRT